MTRLLPGLTYKSRLIVLPTVVWIGLVVDEVGINERDVDAEACDSVFCCWERTETVIGILIKSAISITPTITCLLLKFFI